MTPTLTFVGFMVPAAIGSGALMAMRFDIVQVIRKIVTVWIAVRQDVQWMHWQEELHDDQAQQAHANRKRCEGHVFPNQQVVP